MRERIEIGQETKPCPYCGSDAEMIRFVANYDGHDCNQYTLKCKNDGWNGSEALCIRPSSTQCGPFIDGYQNLLSKRTDQEAINENVRLWNQRDKGE